MNKRKRRRRFTAARHGSDAQHWKQVGGLVTKPNDSDSPSAPAADLKRQLESLLNSFGRDNASNTPDFILAEYMMSCLVSFELATKRRDEWYMRYSGGACPWHAPAMAALVVSDANAIAREASVDASPPGKIIHMADKISQSGQVSALCFERPRAINLKRASWVMRPEAVTCKKCLAKLA